MSLLALVAAAALAAPTPAARTAPVRPGTTPAAATNAAPAAGERPDLSARPGSHGGDTRCAACHIAAGWRQVTFAHDWTGFPLTGRHKDVTCQACHTSGDFGKPLPRACSACHRDVHSGRLGARCDRCHATASWKEASFGPDAHQRTAFPLTGRHAIIACEECHSDRRDRTFARPTPRCIGCHQADFDRTAMAGLDHGPLGANFGTDCRQCHGAWRFRPGLFAVHEQCFSIRSGPHAGIACRDCHTAGLPPYTGGQALTCNSPPPADCLHCHSNVAPLHTGVSGFQLSNQRCYECHRFSLTLRLAPRFGGGGR